MQARKRESEAGLPAHRLVARPMVMAESRARHRVRTIIFFLVFIVFLLLFGFWSVDIHNQYIRYSLERPCRLRKC